MAIPLIGLAARVAAMAGAKTIGKKAAQETAEASTRAIAKQAERKVLQEAKESAAKEAAEASAKQAQNKAFNRANMGDKLKNYSQEEKAAMGNKVNEFKLQEPGVSYRPLDHKDVMRNMGEFKKGGKVKASSASKRADGCAVRGKTKGKVCQENRMAKVTEAQKRKNYEATVGSSENDMRPVPKSKSVPIKVIKAGDMSAETKALPDEVVEPPKGIGESEKDMGPLPAKKKGGMIKSSASSRADGCAVRGKTRA